MSFTSEGIEKENKMNKLFIICAALFLVACSLGPENPTQPISTDETARYELPEGMKDCKIYKIGLKDDGFSFLAMRCPASTVSLRYGKYGHTEVVEESK